MWGFDGVSEDVCACYVRIRLDWITINVMSICVYVSACLYAPYQQRENLRKSTKMLSFLLLCLTHSIMCPCTVSCSYCLGFAPLITLIEWEHCLFTGVTNIHCNVQAHILCVHLFRSNVCVPLSHPVYTTCMLCILAIRVDCKNCWGPSFIH